MDGKNGVRRGSVLVLGHMSPLTRGTLSNTSHCVTGVDSTPRETAGCEKAVHQLQLNKAWLIQK